MGSSGNLWAFSLRPQINCFQGGNKHNVKMTISDASMKNARRCVFSICHQNVWWIPTCDLRCDAHRTKPFIFRFSLFAQRLKYMITPVDHSNLQFRGNCSQMYAIHYCVFLPAQCSECIRCEIRVTVQCLVSLENLILDVQATRRSIQVNQPTPIVRIASRSRSGCAAVLQTWIWKWDI